MKQIDWSKGVNYLQLIYVSYQPVDDKNIAPGLVRAYLKPRAAFCTVKVTRLIYFILSESKGNILKFKLTS